MHINKVHYYTYELCDESWIGLPGTVEQISSRILLQLMWSSVQTVGWPALANRYQAGEDCALLLELLHFVFTSGLNM